MGYLHRSPGLVYTNLMHILLLLHAILRFTEASFSQPEGWQSHIIFGIRVHAEGLPDNSLLAFITSPESNDAIWGLTPWFTMNVEVLLSKEYGHEEPFKRAVSTIPESTDDQNSNPLKEELLPGAFTFGFYAPKIKEIRPSASSYSNATTVYVKSRQSLPDNFTLYEVNGGDGTVRTKIDQISLSISRLVNTFFECNGRPGHYPSGLTALSSPQLISKSGTIPVGTKLKLQLIGPYVGHIKHFFPPPGHQVRYTSLSRTDSNVDSLETVSVRQSHSGSSGSSSDEPPRKMCCNGMGCTLL